MVRVKEPRKLVYVHQNLPPHNFDMEENAYLTLELE